MGAFSSIPGLPDHHLKHLDNFECRCRSEQPVTCCQSPRRRSCLLGKAKLSKKIDSQASSQSVRPRTKWSKSLQTDRTECKKGGEKYKRRAQSLSNHLSPSLLRCTGVERHSTASRKPLGQATSTLLSHHADKSIQNFKKNRRENVKSPREETRMNLLYEGNNSKKE